MPNGGMSYVMLYGRLRSRWLGFFNCRQQLSLPMTRRPSSGESVAAKQPRSNSIEPADDEPCSCDIIMGDPISW